MFHAMPQLKTPELNPNFRQKYPSSRIIKAKAARAHSVLLIENMSGLQNVVTVGNHEMGQCGAGEPIGQDRKVMIPIIPDELSNVNVDDIAVGLDHTLALTSEGKVK